MCTSSKRGLKQKKNFAEVCVLPKVTGWEIRKSYLPSEFKHNMYSSMVPTVDSSREDKQAG